MRVWRYLLAEVVLFLAVIIGGGTGAVRATAYLGERMDREAVLARMLPPHGDIGQQLEPPIQDEPGGMFLGMSDDLLLARIRTQPIVATKLNRGGSSLSFRVEFADGSRAAFKPAQTNLQTIPRKEVAAYRINRMLGLDAVPPAAPRSISREDLLANLHEESRYAVPRIMAETIFNPAGKTAGMMQYWVPAIKDSGLDTDEGMAQTTAWLTIGNMIPANRREMAAQVSDNIVFDFVTANPDRYSGGNMKMSIDGRRLFFMDNTMAFFLAPQGTESGRRVLGQTMRFSRRLYQALDRLTPDRIEMSLRQADPITTEILTRAEIRAVTARRSYARRHIGELIAQHGEEQVLLFP